MVRNPWTALIAVLDRDDTKQRSRIGWARWDSVTGGSAFSSHIASARSQIMPIYVIIHDATHNLILRAKAGTKWWASSPISESHTRRDGFSRLSFEASFASGRLPIRCRSRESLGARLVGNKWYRKAIWLMLFPFFQLTRPPRLKAIKMWDRWFLVNVACAAAYDAQLLLPAGGPDFCILRSRFSSRLGCTCRRALDSGALHLRFRPGDIQLLRPINVVALNMGYHNEHHDLPSIPWNNLPKLRVMAPEFYNNLKYHTSWTRLLFQFHF